MKQVIHHLLPHYKNRKLQNITQHTDWRLHLIWVTEHNIHGWIFPLICCKEAHEVATEREKCVWGVWHMIVSIITHFPWLLSLVCLHVVGEGCVTPLTATVNQYVHLLSFHPNGVRLCVTMDIDLLFHDVTSHCWLMFLLNISISEHLVDLQTQRGLKILNILVYVFMAVYMLGC